MAKRPGDKPDHKSVVVEPSGGDYKIKPQKPTGLRPKGERPGTGSGKGKPAR